jgi:sugar lactone lactonase YvrE
MTLPMSIFSQTPSYFMHNNVSFLWETDKVLKIPESVFYNAQDNMLYVSNINGKSNAKDGNGFISKISLNGKIKELKWAEGMNAPKGMGKSGDFLYVTDVDKVHKISFQTGEIVKSFKVDEAKFLNDIDVHQSGDIYVSDMQTSKIYRIKDNSINLWLSDKQLNRTNGLYATDSHLFIGMADQIIRVNYDDKKITSYIKDTGGVDGLELFSGESFLFSDWQGRVYSASPDNSITKLIDTRSANKNAADIEFIKGKNILLVPTFMANSVSAYKISTVP